MRLTFASMLALAVVPALCQRGPDGTGEQMNLDSIHNVTSLEGTWSSGSKAVTTGDVRSNRKHTSSISLIRLQTFANPINRTFTYPTNTGVAFSL
jgi:hypothetical protein